MRVVVTGATGFVGQNLVRALATQNIEVIALVHNKDRIPQDWQSFELIQCIECNMRDYATISDLTLKNFSADILVHLAWAGTSGTQRANEALQLENVQAACDAVRLARRLGCTKFINAGSIMEYEAKNYLSVDGTMPGGGYIYSTAKLTADYMAKCIAKQMDMAYINIIISNIYGVGERSERFLVSTVRKLIKNENVPLTGGQQLYDFIYVTDSVNAIVKVIENGKPFNNYYIGNKTQYPLREFLLRMKQVLASASVLEFGKIPFNGPLLSYEEFDTARLENELGFTPQISFEEGIILLKKWLEKEDNV